MEALTLVQVDHQTATLDDLRTRRLQPERLVAAAVFRWLSVVRRSGAMSSRRRTVGAREVLPGG